MIIFGNKKKERRKQMNFHQEINIPLDNPMAKSGNVRQFFDAIIKTFSTITNKIIISFLDNESLYV